ncbi:hypothetical protein F3Y22_tig00110152pilonHSYRG00038 [Hibiscus syriacus]|uniref:Uncharacterized protein n=1 Tax=Hibiscus syriacus TaxID=106335 RepID=A0A6A3BHT0_HIBSY|nr:hypothetical protein F3Y22_tig00110152pilonHSYRG00038 [Hibiscus syriacus]
MVPAVTGTCTPHASLVSASSAMIASTGLISYSLNLFTEDDDYEIFVLLVFLQALGHYTEKINDFSVFPSQAREGRAGHLLHVHRLVMYNLCLEGRKVFISEQNLYSRAQLNQHLETCDSEVDGTENERGGFMGHPMSDFCKTSFNVETEYMSYTPKYPGQYKYYKNYDNRCWVWFHYGGKPSPMNP